MKVFIQPKMNGRAYEANTFATGFDGVGSISSARKIRQRRTGRISRTTFMLMIGRFLRSLVFDLRH